MSAGPTAGSRAELTQAQRRQLDAWNDTAAPALDERCMHALIARQATATPDAEAILGSRALSYQQLMAASARLGALLRVRGVGRGHVVALWFRDPVEGVIAGLAAWSVGAAFLPIDEGLPKERLAFMLEDSEAPLLLTQQSLLATLTEAPAIALCVDDLPQVPTEAPGAAPVVVEPDDVAYVIYTSGLTGRPKGVAIRHRNLANFVVARSRVYGRGPRFMPIHPLAFDPAVGGVAWTLATGGALCMVDAETRRDPDALRSAISRFGLTHMSGVPALHAAILQDAVTGELPSLRACTVGGERLPPALAEAHYAKLPNAGLFNEYGPTETTVSSTVYAVPRTDVPDPVPIGRPLANTSCYVLDEQGQLLPPGASGELYIGGEGVGAGYLNRAELTRDRFVPDPFAAQPGARMYRTGDRARWLPDGLLEFQGRLDFQVKVRGYRVELQEIEHCLETCEGVRAAVVVVTDKGATSNLAAYYTTVDGKPRPALKETLSAALPPYMVPAFLRHMSELPTNSSGKIDRRGLPDPVDELVAEPIGDAPSLTRTEQQVAEIWREVLSIERVGRSDDFFALGGHSLSATMVVSRVREKIGMRVPVRVLFAAPTLEAFALAIERDGQAVLRGRTELLEEQLSEVPIAPLQETFWYLARIEPDSAAYVVGSRFRVRGPLDADRLARALATVVARNEVLRTRFVILHGEPIQVVLPALDVPIERHDLRGHATQAQQVRTHLRELVHRPFDIEACPLLRCQLLRVDDEEHVLCFAVHHIVFDGWSVSLLLQQVFGAYSALEIAEAANVRDRYREHAYVARVRLGGVRLEELRNYWRSQLRDLPQPLSLRTDFPRSPDKRERGGASARGKLPPDLTQRLRARCVELGTTHFAFCLAVFKLIVSRWTGEHDVVVGAPMAIRDESHLENMIGCFVNSIVLRTEVPELTAAFSELLARVKTTVVGGLAHAELPFDWLVADLKPERTRRNENPLFRLFFNDIDRRRELPELEGIEVSQIPDEDPISKFDLTFYVHEWRDHDELELVYDPALFSAEHMQEFVAQFESVLEQAVQDVSRQLGAYRLRSERSHSALPDPVAPLNATLGDGLLQDAVFAQAITHPERTAVVDRLGQVSYLELCERANAVAHALVDAGARPGDRIAIYATRSTGLVTALLGVLEAGGLFTILDPDQPAAWNCRLLESLGAQGFLCIDDVHVPNELAQQVEQRVAVRVRTDARARSAQRVAVPRTADSPAYVIFTSGTTGGPKAVMGSHRPVLHFLGWYAERFAITQHDRFSMLSGLGHDPLLRDVFTPLSKGATLCVPTAEIRKEADRLAGWLKEHSVSVAHLTPSLGTVIAAALVHTGPLEALRLMLFGGERLRNQDVVLARRYAPNARVVNCDGTTETPQVMGYCELPSDASGIVPPIGRGIGDTQLLVINPYGAQSGVGELGTIHVRSPYLSYGYVDARDSGVEPSKADVYVTGDLGHYDSGGRVHFVGRGDRQAKVRGFRVELAAIEAALESLPGVTRAHVIAREATDGSVTLDAYIVAPPSARDSTKLRAALQAQLLEAMVPSSLTFLDSLPLTANGKVDAKRLVADTTQQRTSRPAYLEPRSQTEDVIARLWAELFELDRVGVDDDFFELGGHSLLAVRMTGTLSERLATRVPLGLLSQHSTVAALAAALHTSGSIAEEKLVVELRTGGTRPPFWIIHPVGGYVVFARRFVALLDRDQNVLGIQAQGLDGRKEPFQSLPEMAGHYLELIRSYQPSGPYYIGGPSLGGKVCYEIAQQLAAAGEVPAMVAMFDTFAPGFPQTKSPVRWLRDKVAQLTEEGWKSSVTRIGQRLIGRGPPRGFVDYQAAELNEPFGATLKKVIAANEHASRSYEVRPYPGTITMFRAKHQPLWPGMDFSDVTNGWGRFAAHVDVEVIDTTHHRIFDDPAVHELARKFTASVYRAFQKTLMRVSRVSTMGGSITRISDPGSRPSFDSKRPPPRSERE